MDAGQDTNSDIDSDADTDSDSDADGDSDADTDSDSDADGDTDTEIKCPSPGVVVGESCWFALPVCIGDEGEGCASIPEFSLDLETNFYAGPDGTLEHCQAVLDALGLGTQGSIPIEDNQAFGCHYHTDLNQRNWGNQRIDYILPWEGVVRACACVG